MLHRLHQALSNKCCAMAGQQTFSRARDEIAELRLDAFFFPCLFLRGFDIDEINLTLIFPRNSLPYSFVPLVQIGRQQFVGCTFLLKRAMKEKFNPALVQFTNELVSEQHSSMSLNNVETCGQDKH